MVVIGDIKLMCEHAAGPGENQAGRVCSFKDVSPKEWKRLIAEMLEVDTECVSRIADGGELAVQIDWRSQTHPHG